MVIDVICAMASKSVIWADLPYWVVWVVEALLCSWARAWTRCRLVSWASPLRGILSLLIYIKQNSYFIYNIISYDF